MQLKARREARHSSSKLSTSISAPSSQPSASTSFPEKPVPFPASGPVVPIPPVTVPPRPFDPDTSLLFTVLPDEPEMDFSPSRDASSSKPGIHPVPFSADDGATLDWSNIPEDEARERRWSLSVSKRKGKEKMPLVTPAAIQNAEKQFEGDERFTSLFYYRY
jgi:hypothetical protein